MFSSRATTLARTSYWREQRERQQLVFYKAHKVVYSNFKNKGQSYGHIRIKVDFLAGAQQYQKLNLIGRIWLKIDQKSNV